MEGFSFTKIAKFKIILSALAFISLVFLGCDNQQSSDYERITLNYLRYFYDYDWEKLSALVHPESIQEFRDLLITTNKSLDSLELNKKGNTDTDTLLNYLRNTNINNVDPNMFLGHFMELALPSKLMKLSGTKLTPQITCLGYVNDGSDTIHVVYKTKVLRNDVSVSGVDILSLKKYNDEWRVLLPYEIINQMKLRLKTQRQRFPF